MIYAVDVADRDSSLSLVCLSRDRFAKQWETEEETSVPHCVCLFSQSCLTFWTPWTVATGLLCPQAFPRQEYWSGLPCPPPGDHPNPGIKPRSPTLQANSLPSEPLGKPKDTGGIVYPSCRGSAQPRNQTGVSCIAGEFFTSWATREAPQHQTSDPHSLMTPSSCPSETIQRW